MAIDVRSEVRPLKKVLLQRQIGRASCRERV